MTGEPASVPVDQIEFIKELYPRLREDDAAIERYRHSLDRLPPITTARGRVLVDGFHRLQAHKREKAATIHAIDLGNLTDLEIRKESLRRNSSHGRQLETSDKRKQAGELYLLGVEEAELKELLSITKDTLETYLREAKRLEKKQQQAKAWDLWLDCLSERQIAELVGVDQATINRWLRDAKADESAFASPVPLMTFDIWSLHKADDDAGSPSYFGRMPPQVVENLLWLYTQPGQIVFDPFAGGGTTIEVAKRMGRRVWASDLSPSTPTLPIHKFNIMDDWPDTAPKKVDFILLDPPYWQQAKGRYSDDAADLGNVTLDEFRKQWGELVWALSDHLTPNGKLAFIISPTQQEDGSVIDHAFEMYQACVEADLKPLRRIIVPYQTQQATGQQVQWAKDGKRLLKLYRDLGVFTR